MTNLAVGILFQTLAVFSETAFPFASVDLLQTFWLLFPQAESCEKHWYHRTSFPSTVNINRQHGRELLAEKNSTMAFINYIT